MQRDATRRLLSLVRGGRSFQNLLGPLAPHGSKAAYASAAAPQPSPIEEPVNVSVELPPVVDAQAALTPKQIVGLLDKHIIGQAAAKKAVANALRSRWRRRQVPSPLKDEIMPKNILMLGPTGCGKTEIARRLAKLADAPFVKVEATKFTEVGFHGRDVDQIIRDLVENSLGMVRTRLRKKHQQAIDAAVEDTIVFAMIGEHASKETIASFKRLYRDGELDDREVEIDVSSTPQRLQAGGPGQDQIGLQEMVIRVDKLFRNAGNGGVSKKKCLVAEAKVLLEESEAEKFMDPDSVNREAIDAVEQDGIVFIDEIDKIVSGSERRYGADASSEGVQRDLLPIIEGSVVNTKHGNVRTDYILFICSGAFHHAKPSDMLAELQGRLPVRVELKGLSKDDFFRILREPEGSIIKQQAALLNTEGVALEFSDDAIWEIAAQAELMNETVENVGARRLFQLVERVVEEISFDAPELSKDTGKSTIRIERADVIERVKDLSKKKDLTKYVL
jgi:ATP-dependent HslUV protease ATP-binding subunit HslU